MVFYDMHRSAATPISTDLATRIVGAVFEWLDGRQTRKMARTRARLLELSDAALADLGLIRADLLRR